MPGQPQENGLPTTTAGPPLGRHYGVAGRRLLLHRSGDGGPGVVFLPGAGLVGLDFLNVADRAAEFTTSVLYDRGGTGWSDPVDLPRTATEVVDELRDLLRAAAVPGPYLLAGHSLGAFYARRYAQRYPDEVAALLLLDPGHEDILSYLPAQAAQLNEQLKSDVGRLPELTDEQLDAARAALTKLYAQWPESVREPLTDYHLTGWRTGVREAQNLDDEVSDELRQGGPLPDVPLIVLTAMAGNPHWAQVAPEPLVRETQEGIFALHRAMAAAVARGEHRPVDGARHQSLHVERPDAVLRAIRDLIDRAGGRA